MKDSLLPSPTHLKSIFFDLDDTLVFSEKTHTQAWHLLLPAFGIDPKQIDFQSMTGMSDMEQAKRFTQTFKLKEEPQLLWELKRKTFLELIKNGFESAQGRNTFLTCLADKYTLGVVSSSPQRVINEVLKLEKIHHYFNFIIGYEDCIRHKPDPLPYQNALVQANVEPHEALVIEDSFTGITAAKRASIPVIGILKDQRPEQIINDVKYFHNFSEIHLSLFQS